MNKGVENRKNRNKKIIDSVDEEMKLLNEGSLYARFDIATERVAKRIFLEKNTVVAIYKGYGNYGDKA